jgi:plastocyanin
MRWANAKARAFGLAAVVLVGVFLSTPAATAAATPQPATHEVVVEAVRFDPQVLTVNVGDTIVWINHDPFPHTVTAQGGQFDSHEIAAGHSWKFKATKAGVFPYICTLHPTMLATLRVQ